MRFSKALFFVLLLRSASAVDFYCNFSGSYTCKVTQGSIQTLDDAYLISVFGTHVYGKNNTDVTSFDARGQVIRFFPRIIANVFPNLENIYIEGGMYDLHREDIEYLPRLRGLYLCYNNIEYLEPNLFIYNTNLQVIVLESNNLKYIDPNVFSPLTQLTSLDLTKNNCVAARASGSSAVASLVSSATSLCSDTFNPQLTQIVNLELELQRLVLVNGNLTAKCAKNEFVPNNSTIIKLF